VHTSNASIAIGTCARRLITISTSRTSTMCAAGLPGMPCNKIKRNIDFTDRGAVTNRDAVVAKARVYVTGIRERDSQRMHAEMALIMQLPAICVAIGDTAPVVDGPAAFSQASSSPVETIVPDARN
jgi:hypothetical protein